MKGTASDEAPAVLHSVGADSDRLSLTRAAAATGRNRHTLRGLAEAELVRHAKVHGRQYGPHGIGYLFVLADLKQDLAALSCAYVDAKGRPCTETSVGPSGGCEKHGHALAMTGVPRPPEVRAKISAAKTGKPRPDLVEPMRARMTKYPPKEMFCKCCGKSLGMILGWVIRDGGGKFCLDCVHNGDAGRWVWEHVRGGAQGSSEFPCAICSRPVERWPSQQANAEAGGYRFICTVCDAPYRKFRAAAERAADSAKPNAPVSTASLAAFERLLVVAQAFEDEILKSWPRTGRRPPLAADLVIATLHRRGFTDESIFRLLNAGLESGTTRIPGVNGHLSDAQYVKQRRHRTGIRRVPARGQKGV